ncbi:hypothetical protein Drorol1_Dr00013472 [Drosera rotundifolia]
MAKKMVYVSQGVGFMKVSVRCVTRGVVVKGVQRIGPSSLCLEDVKFSFENQGFKGQREEAPILGDSSQTTAAEVVTASGLPSVATTHLRSYHKQPSTAPIHHTTRPSHQSKPSQNPWPRRLTPSTITAPNPKPHRTTFHTQNPPPIHQTPKHHAASPPATTLPHQTTEPQSTGNQITTPIRSTFLVESPSNLKPTTTTHPSNHPFTTTNHPSHQRPSIITTRGGHRHDCLPLGAKEIEEELRRTAAKGTTVRRELKEGEGDWRGLRARGFRRPEKEGEGGDVVGE